MFRKVQKKQMSKIITAHQPAYLPWLGYFAKLAASDVYVYMDSVQFEHNSFTNRNKIKVSGGKASWLTIPVLKRDHLNATMMTLEIDNSRGWKQKHLKSIFFNYKKAPHFDFLYAKLEKLYEKDYELLVDLCYDHLVFWLEYLNIDVKIVKLSQMDIQSENSDLVIDMCKVLQADQYISGALGKDYLDTSDFKKINTQLLFQQYEHPTYPQLWGDFLPYMSIIDFCMNTNDFELIRKGNQLS